MSQTIVDVYLSVFENVGTPTRFKYYQSYDFNSDSHQATITERQQNYFKLVYSNCKSFYNVFVANQFPREVDEVINQSNKNSVLDTKSLGALFQDSQPRISFRNPNFSSIS